MTTTVIKWKLNEMLSQQRKTSRDLAEHLGIHENSVYRLRKEDKMPRLNHDTLEGICLFLNCQPGDLLELVKDK
ncbi:helix-turn-helix transcriptional regulator [Microcoleus sp. FACHB-1515]|uniref:helix-turn-helix domain-containing protein n=1 Tax=Cyanophyceae TaxID=3028117 RepID=UPI001688ABCA|nr:helix-turn-helix transcriptional regulator [Microcoleus sp. FACHB-1515]MBD2089246.1 helix-turn-helix transcriptional regulator [Microcoleus sp. FACHB-1515]